MELGRFVISDIVNAASQKLQSRTLGGVTKESAMDALNTGVTDAVRKGQADVDEVKGQAERELQEYKDKTSREMADLTSQKDMVIFQTKKEAAEQVDAAKKAARASKTSQKTLSNGNVQIRTVNHNGAVMEKEVTPDDVVVRYEVTNLDGDYRKGTFNPITKKPVKTFDNVNGDKIMEYDDEGKLKSIKDVNVKKVKPEKPTIVSQSKPEYIRGDFRGDFSGERGVKIKRTYSDGSTEEIKRYTDENNVVKRTVSTTKDKNDVTIASVLSNPECNYIRKNTYNPETKEAFFEESYEHNGRKIFSSKKEVYDKDFDCRRAVKEVYINGDAKAVLRAVKDDFGLYNGNYEAVFYKDGKKVDVKVGTGQELGETFSKFIAQ